MDNPKPLTETQKFFVGEQVAWIDANNRLRFGVVKENLNGVDYTRVQIQYGKGSDDCAAPHRTRVAHLTPN